MTPVELVLERLQGVRRTGQGQWQALCPVHDDRQASLSVTEGKEGQALVKCHADCNTADILASIGLSFRELYPQAPPQDLQQERKGKITATYDYTDEAGRVLYQVVRYVPKTFRQRQPHGADGWSWSMKGVRRVLYRLPAVRAAVERGDTVLIVEGEKDADALAALSLAATCNAGGAGKWLKPYSETLKSANVVILPDNDPPGRKHAQNVARELQILASSVKVLELPNLPEKGDLSDWLASGGTREQLRRLIDSCPVWKGRSELAKNRQRFPLTDLGNAERLIAEYGENLRYDVDAGKWIVWNGKRWEYDATAKVHQLAAKVVRNMREQAAGMEQGPVSKALFAHADRSESKPRLEAMVRAAAENIDGVPVRAADLDREPMYLNCLNGTIELRTGVQRPHAREDLMTKLAPVEYDSQAQCPRWTKFLDEVFQGNKDVIDFVQRMAGYLLTGDTTEQTAFILSGKGCNGKSTLVETLRGVLGDYGADTPFSTFVERREANTADLAGLVGKRLVTASEGEESQSFNESLLKRCTGGDPVTCRHLYREFFEYVPTYKIVFSTNEIPRIHSQTYAMKRRIKLIRFEQRFYDAHEGKMPVKDPRLPAKLLGERNGILAWAVQGCLEWRRNGLNTPAVIRLEVDKLFENQDPLAEFIDAECEIRPGVEDTVRALYAAYEQWCQEAGRKSLSAIGFSRSLQQRDGIDGKKGTGGVRMLTGITLNSGGSGGFSPFSENSPMREQSKDFSQDTQNPPLCATPERQSGGTVADSPAEDTRCFESEDDFDSLAALAPQQEDLQ